MVIKHIARKALCSFTSAVVLALITVVASCGESPPPAIDASIPDTDAGIPLDCIQRQQAYVDDTVPRSEQTSVAGIVDAVIARPDFSDHMPYCTSVSGRSASGTSL